MGQHTDIEWADSTVNPTTGCDGCELHVPGKGGPCYAGILHETRLAKSLPVLYAPKFTEVRLAPGRMAQAAAWPDLAGKARSDKPWFDGRPRHIFVGDMGDVFSGGVPFGYLKAELIDVAMSSNGRRHVWMVLTKQPKRMADFHHWLLRMGIEWPANVWAGTSVTSRKTLRRIAHLMRLRATLFVSAEPLFEDVADGLAEYLSRTGVVEDDHGFLYNTPSLVIAGGESGSKARPTHPDWFRKLRDRCRETGTMYFFKQWGEWLAVDTYPERGVRWNRIDRAGRVVTGLPGLYDDSDVLVARVGKKAAGRLLDGVTHDAFPEVAPRA